MQAQITIEMDNAAFADGNALIETGRILSELGSRLDGWGRTIPEEPISTHPMREVTLRDVNGNTVGKFEITETDEPTLADLLKPALEQALATLYRCRDRERHPIEEIELLAKIEHALNDVLCDIEQSPLIE